VNYGPFIRANNKISEQLSSNSKGLNNQKIEDLKDSKSQKNDWIDLANYVKWSDSGNSEMSNKPFDDYTKTAYFSPN
jgi:hypothetical protein